MASWLYSVIDILLQVEDGALIRLLWLLLLPLLHGYVNVSRAEHHLKTNREEFCHYQLLVLRSKVNMETGS